MKLYAVFQNDPEGSDLKGVFTERKLAEEFIDHTPAFYCSIAEIETDPTVFPCHMAYTGTSFYQGEYHI